MRRETNNLLLLFVSAVPVVAFVAQLHKLVERIVRIGARRDVRGRLRDRRGIERGVMLFGDEKTSRRRNRELTDTPEYIAACWKCEASSRGKGLLKSWALGGAGTPVSGAGGGFWFRGTDRSEENWELSEPTWDSTSLEIVYGEVILVDGGGRRQAGEKRKAKNEAGGREEKRRSNRVILSTRGEARRFRSKEHRVGPRYYRENV